MAAPVPPAQAPAASSHIPFVTDAMRLVRVLFAPGAVFDEQKEQPTWFVPWLIVAILCVVIGFWNLPYSQRTIELALQNYPNAPQLTDAQMRSRAMMGLPFLPIIFLIFALIGAGIMYLVVTIFGGRARFRGMLSASVFSQVLLPITLLLQCVILRMRGSPAEAITTMADAQPALGLNVLLTSDSRFMQAIYAGIGPLQLWAIFIMAVGVTRLESVKKSTAWWAAIIQFVVLLLIAAGLSTLGGGRG